MLRKSIVLAAVASASAFAGVPAVGSCGVSAVAHARPMSLRGGASAVKMVSTPNPGLHGAACAPACTAPGAMHWGCTGTNWGVPCAPATCSQATHASQAEVTPNVKFDTIAREWRCKWSADGDKASLVKAQDELSAIIKEVSSP